MKRSGNRHRRLSERLLLVLAGAGRPLSLRELAHAVGVYDSSARYAVIRLVERAIVRHADGRYSLTAGGDLLDFQVRHSVRAMGAVDALRLMVAPNRSIAFVSLRRGGATADVVLAQVVEPSDVLRLRELAKRYLGLELHEHEYRELQGTTVQDQAALGLLRQQITKGELVKGDSARLPRPGVRGDFTRARPLHRPNPQLPRLSRRTLQRLGRRYELAGLSLFGSAVRADFRPDSDVDVLVRYRPEARRTIASSSGLRDELSEHLGHGVDLVDERSIDPDLRANIARDIVRLYGRSPARALASRPGEEKRPGRDRRTSTARKRLDE
jgi:predicted nucleotidyltransferase